MGWQSGPQGSGEGRCEVSAIKITLVHSPDHDWVGLYVDGELKHEGHSINENEMLELLQPVYEFEHESIEAEFEDRLPKRLSQVKR